MRIIICTTFIDFCKKEIDEVQTLFLLSLEKQSEKNFELFVTQFNDKEIESIIKPRSYDVQITYFQNEKKIKYSHSILLKKCIEYVKEKKYENYLIVWVKSDVIFDNNFIRKLNLYYRENMIGICHPYNEYKDLKTYKEKTNSYSTNLSTSIELVIIDKKFIEENNLLILLEEYKFFDWGFFENFLCSIGKINKSTMINFYESTKISHIKKISRNREIDDDSFMINARKNENLLNNFLQKNNLSFYLKEEFYIHFQFKNTKNSLKHFIRFSKEIIPFFYRFYLRKIKKIIFKLISKIIAKFLKYKLKKN